MNLIFMRHGEATHNVEEIISDKEIYWSVLTDKGKKSVLDSIQGLPKNIDRIYVSPLPRTIETASYVYKIYSDVEVIIESRLREIDHGKYSGQKNNIDLDNVRLKQINGDYLIRLGDYGENRYDIEKRLCDLLDDIYKNSLENDTVMIISHGSITSYMERILDIKTPHIKTGKAEEYINVDFSKLYNHFRLLDSIKKY